MLVVGPGSTLTVARVWTVPLDNTTTTTMRQQSALPVPLGHTQVRHKQRNVRPVQMEHMLHKVRLNASTVQLARRIRTETHPRNAHSVLLARMLLQEGHLAQIAQ